MSTINAITYDDGTAITPSDSVPQGKTKPYAALYVGGAGNVVLVTPSNTTLTFNGLAAGTILPVAFRQINNTSTTATGLIGLRATPYLGNP